jgi:hypothetical protein
VTDRFDVMTADLLGEPLPALPLLPGRRHALVDDGDAPDDLAGMSAADVARIVGLTRQAASLRVKAARESGRWDRLLAPKFSNGLADGVAPARSSIVDHVRTYE